MFTFRNDDDSTRISRYIDGEMSDRERLETERMFATDPDMEQHARKFHALSELLSAPPPAGKTADAYRRVQSRLQHTVYGRHSSPVWWQRSISLPMPVAAAASVLFIVMALGLIVRSGMPSRPQYTANGLGDLQRPVNVQVQVGRDDSDLLLQWLESQNDVGKVTIQLPEYAEFQLRGEPVLMRRSGRNGETSQEEMQHEIVPLEGAQE